jgi:hypothetical protein
VPPEKIKDKEDMISNPAYEEWYVVNQQVLAYLLLSLSREIMGQVAICITATFAWGIIEGMYTSGTRARSINTRITLATLADEVVLASKKIDDEDLISCILVGLDFEYNSVVSALFARPDAISIGEVYSQLPSYEQHVERQQGGLPSFSKCSKQRSWQHPWRLRSWQHGLTWRIESKQRKRVSPRSWTTEHMWRIWPRQLQ